MQRKTDMRTRPPGVTVIAGLALLQGLLALLVGVVLMKLASFFEGGGILAPLIMILAEVNGWFWIALAMLYAVFAIGAWRLRDWTWWMGILVSVLTLLDLLSIFLKGGSVMAVAGMTVPIIILAYLLSAAGRQAFVRGRHVVRPPQ